MLQDPKKIKIFLGLGCEWGSAKFLKGSARSLKGSAARTERKLWERIHFLRPLVFSRFFGRGGPGVRISPNPKGNQPNPEAWEALEKNCNWPKLYENGTKNDHSGVARFKDFSDAAAPVFGYRRTPKEMIPFRTFGAYLRTLSHFWPLYTYPFAFFALIYVPFRTFGL